MKNNIAILLLMLIFLLAAGCRAAGEMPSSPKYDPSEYTPTQSKINLPGRQLSYQSGIAWVNWNEDPITYSMAQNAASAKLQGHLPIYVITSYQELNDFRNTFRDTFCWEQRYDEIASTNEMLYKYDDAYFEEHDLFLIYVPSSSGSLRFAVESVSCGDGGNIYVRIRQTNNPECVTCDMAGWLCAAEVKKADTLNYVSVDAGF